MTDILLATLNARYSHSSLGLRYLLANMGELQPRAALREFTIHERPIDIAEQLLAMRPRIIGLAVYIWNARESLELVSLLKTISPETLVVLGGPEVSYEPEQQELVRWADYSIGGPGEVSLPALCRQLLAGEQPPQKVIAGTPPELSRLVLPYALYSDEDIAHRTLYVEASRGCPFKCEFCLSALDRTATPFPLDDFLSEMATLWSRGARRFKFVDRTFNLKVDSSIRIMEFFLERMAQEPPDAGTFLHFEVIPDHLPERLKATIQRFPPGTLQFEVGVQSFNPEVQTLISRKQDNAKSAANLRWLREQSHAHIHADLIIGLPGEDMASFAAGFDELWSIGPHEIQVGMLKRLRGSPIIRHSDAFTMRYQAQPPYTVLATDRIAFTTMQRLARFARYWDLVANSGRFRATLPLLLGDSPFAHFMAFSDWLYAHSDQTHRFSLDRLFALLKQGLVEALDGDEEEVIEALWQDFQRAGIKGIPKFFRERGLTIEGGGKRGRSGHARQARHLAPAPEQQG